MSANDRDRGQLLLVAGLTIAVILVALVLLLNTVIYTENVATRGLDTETDDGLQYRATVVDSVEEIIAEENRQLLQDYSKVDSNVTNGTSLLRGSLELRHHERGSIAKFSMSKRSGTHIWQENDSDFTGGSQTWDVVSSIDEVRRFKMTIGESYLTNNSSEAFEIVNGGDSIRVYSNGSGILVDTPSDSCSATDPANLDFVNNTVDGTVCSGLDVSPGTLRFENGSRAGGTYELTVAENVIPDTNVPNYAKIVYDADLKVEYHSRDVSYETTVHVEGAEPR